MIVIVLQLWLRSLLNQRLATTCQSIETQTAHLWFSARPPFSPLPDHNPYLILACFCACLCICRFIYLCTFLSASRPSPSPLPHSLLECAFVPVFVSVVLSVVLYIFVSFSPLPDHHHFFILYLNVLFFALQFSMYLSLYLSLGFLTIINILSSNALLCLSLYLSFFLSLYLTLYPVFVSFSRLPGHHPYSFLK